MKCYVHQSTEAVGVCSTCGRGLCRVCAVKLGGKLYCQDDADKTFSGLRTTVQAPQKTRAKPKAKANAPPRGVGVIVGSLSAYILGGTAAIISFLVLFTALMGGETAGAGLFSSPFGSELSFLGPLDSYPSQTVLDLGIALLVFGSFGIGAGFYLWRPSKAGAVAAVVFGLAGVAGAFELSTIPVNSGLVDVWFILSGVTIAMSFLALIQLTKPRQGRMDALPSTGAIPGPKNNLLSQDPYR